MAEQAKSREVVVLTIEGAAEHLGHPMAHAVRDKLDRFLKTFAGFERARIGKRARQTDFEIVFLDHNSPAEIRLNPVPRVPNYTPEPVVTWTLGQWSKITRGETPDDYIGADLINDVAEMSRAPESADFSRFSVAYGTTHLEMNDEAERNATALRDQMAFERRPLPWADGLSLGTITGELRSVLDTYGERQFVIVPPFGPTKVQCNFTEDQREDIRSHLFKFVRVRGVLHYGNKSPFPFMVDLTRIEQLVTNSDHPHLKDGFGLFKESHYENAGSDLL